MGEHPLRVRRRVIPDAEQVQIFLGSLLGSGRIEGRPGARHMSFSHEARREGYVRWKYEQLAQFADEPPVVVRGRACFTTIAHPFFDDLVALAGRARIETFLTPLGRAVWRTDLRRTTDLRVSEASLGEETDLIRES
jgi:hypothetical protein